MPFIWALFGEDGADRSWGRSNITAAGFVGTGQYVGITELASVSDPPRKYRELLPLYSGLVADEGGGTRVGFAAFNRTVYDTAGARTEAVQPAWLNLSSGSPWGAGGGQALLAPGDSLESVNWAALAAPWNGFAPTWTKERLRKYVEAGSFPGGIATVFRGYHAGQGFGRYATVAGSILGCGVFMTWNGAGWTLGLEMYCDDGPTAARSLYARLITGNRDPGTPTTADVLLLNSNAQFPVATLFLPPDVSLRLLIRLNASGNSNETPQQIGTSIVGQVPVASGLTVDVFDRWIHLPATAAELPAWRMEEQLAVEDTPYLALQRAGQPVAPDPRRAYTTALAGGTAAESNAPITITGQASRISHTFGSRVVGNLYRYDLLTVVSDFPSGANPATETLSQEIRATAGSETVEFDLTAPLARQRTALVMSDSNLGPEPPQPPVFDVDTLLWWGRVLAAGGALTSTMVTQMDAQIIALKSAGLWAKLVHYLPFWGTDLTAALVPVKGGAVTNIGPFVAADYSFSAGLQGNGSSKKLELPLTAAQLGAANNGGIGCWTLDVQVSGTSRTVIGSLDNAETQAFHVALRNSGGAFEVFRWGLVANLVNTGAAAQNNVFYYGQRSSNVLRELFRDGVSLGTNVVLDNATNANQRNLQVLGEQSGVGSYFNASRIGAVLCTDGTLTGPESVTLYNITHGLMQAAGRVP